MRLPTALGAQFSSHPLRLLILWCLLTLSSLVYALDIPTDVDISFRSTLTTETFGDGTASAAIVLFSLKTQLYDQLNSFTGSGVDVSSLSIEDIKLSAPQIDTSLPVTMKSLAFGYREQINLPTQWLLRAENVSLSAFRSGNYNITKQGEFSVFSSRINTDVTGSTGGNFSLPRVYFVLHVVFSRPVTEVAPSLDHLDVDIELRTNVKANVSIEKK